MKGMIDGIIITQHISLNRNCWLWKLHVSACAKCRPAMADYANIHTHAHIGQDSEAPHPQECTFSKKGAHKHMHTQMHKHKALH